MSVPNLLKAVLHWSGYGEEGTLSWYLSGSAASHTPDQLQAAAGNAINNMTTDATPSSKTNFLTLLTTQQTVNSMTLYEYQDDSLPATELGVFPVTGWTGTASVMQQGLQTAVCVSLRTALNGPSFRGRLYMPAQAVGMSTTTGMIASGAVDNAANFAAQMSSAIKTGIASSLSINQIHWCVYSRKRRVATPITSLIANNVLDTQRRRVHNMKPTYAKTVAVTTP